MIQDRSHAAVNFGLIGFVLCFEVDELHGGQLAGGSWQLAVGSCQLAVVSCQLSVVSCQLSVGSRQLSVGSSQ